MVNLYLIYSLMFLNKSHRTFFLFVNFKLLKISVYFFNSLKQQAPNVINHKTSHYPLKAVTMCFIPTFFFFFLNLLTPVYSTPLYTMAPVAQKRSKTNKKQQALKPQGKKIAKVVEKIVEKKSKGKKPFFLFDTFMHTRAET